MKGPFLLNPLRTKETSEKYISHLKTLDERVKDMASLNLPIVKEYKYWTIVVDTFPYDKVADTHHLLIPKRVVRSRKDLNEEERIELQYLFEEELPKIYDCSLEKLSDRRRCVKGHLHIHLLNLKSSKSQ